MKLFNTNNMQTICVSKSTLFVLPSRRLANLYTRDKFINSDSPRINLRTFVIMWVLN